MGGRGLVRRRPLSATGRVRWPEIRRSSPLTEHLAAPDDPRVERTRLHPPLSIITIAQCAAIGGAESWDEVAGFGEAQIDWLRTFLDPPHGIPSHDTLDRVFAARDPDQLQTRFVRSRSRCAACR